MKYSWERNTLIETAGSRPTGWRALEPFAGVRFSTHPDSARITGVIALNDSTLEIRLQSVTPWLPWFLSYSFLAVVPREAVEFYRNDLSRHPVGTGPFQLSRWVPNQEIMLVKNPVYRDRAENVQPLPYLNAVHLRFISKPELQFVEFKKGNLDAFSLQNKLLPFLTDEASLKPDRDIKISATDLSLHTVFILMPNPSSPLMSYQTPGGKLLREKIELRQAFNYAINRERIMAAVYPLGNAEIAKGRFPPGLPYTNPKLEGFPYDPERARELLKQINFPHGKGLPPFRIIGSVNPRDVQTVQMVAEDLREIGIQVETYFAPYSELRSLQASLNPEMELNGWVGDYPHPQNFLDFPFPAAYSGTLTESRLQQYYQDWEDQFVSYAPYLFLFHVKPNPLVVRTDVQGLILSPTQMISFKTVQRKVQNNLN